MLRDNALKFYRDQAYDIPQKPIENINFANVNWPLSRENTGWVAFGEVLVFMLLCNACFQ